MKAKILAISIIVLLAFATAIPLIAAAKPDDVQLTVLELKANGKPDGTPGGGKPGGGGNVIPTTDNSESNPDYSLLKFHWFTTADYMINPAGATGFTSEEIAKVVTTSTNTWDEETSARVFFYKGETSATAGVRDGNNVVDWGQYSNNGVIAVTMIWSIGNRIVETDLRMNTHYSWSLTAEKEKMDIQSILTHEFGHWAGLNDLYKNKDYWLTMYGYANNGQDWKQTLGQGDINGLIAVYGA
jgi:hypothetical protein